MKLASQFGDVSTDTVYCVCVVAYFHLQSMSANLNHTILRIADSTGVILIFILILVLIFVGYITVAYRFTGITGAIAQFVAVCAKIAKKDPTGFIVESV